MGVTPWGSTEEGRCRCGFQWFRRHLHPPVGRQGAGHPAGQVPRQARRRGRADARPGPHALRPHHRGLRDVRRPGHQRRDHRREADRLPALHARQHRGPASRRSGPDLHPGQDARVRQPRQGRRHQRRRPADGDLGGRRLGPLRGRAGSRLRLTGTPGSSAPADDPDRTTGTPAPADRTDTSTGRQHHRQTRRPPQHRHHPHDTRPRSPASTRKSVLERLPPRQAGCPS